MRPLSRSRTSSISSDLSIDTILTDYSKTSDYSKISDVSYISKKKDKLRAIVSEKACDSICNYKLGAAIVKDGRRIYAKGCNTPRGKFLNYTDCCQHAEMNAATQFINSVVRPNRRKYCVLRKGKEPPPLQS